MVGHYLLECFQVNFIYERSSKPYQTRDGLSDLREACRVGWGILNQN